MLKKSESFEEIDITPDIDHVRRCWMGIDNGKQGGIVVIDENNVVIHKEVMPTIGAENEAYDLQRIAYVIRYYRPTCVAIEKSLIAGQLTSKQTARMVGYSQGIAEMACASNEIPYVVISPKEWQKWCFTGLPSKDTKVASVLFAKKMQPEIDWRRSERCKNDHDGLTDAYCLAVYCHNKFYR